MMDVKLLVVDAHPVVRWALTRMAAEHSGIESVGEAADAADAASLVAALRPDVVTIDCALPGGAGWRLARDLRDRYHDLGIVILTAQGDDDILFRALDSGASAFVSKEAPVAEILGAIRHAAVAASAFSAAGLAEAMRRRREQSDRLTLSERERQVLHLLQEGRSVPVIATTLYVSLSTAKTYVARLYDKLGASNRAQALMTAVRLGLLADDVRPALTG